MTPLGRCFSRGPRWVAQFAYTDPAVSTSCSFISAELRKRGHSMKSVLFVVIGVAMTFLSSCASYGTRPYSPLRLSVLVEPCAELDVSVRLLDLDGDLHVHGSVCAKGKRASVPGHFDVVVRTADGTEWGRGQAHVRSQFRGGLHAVPTRWTFDATFGGGPPDGSTVSVAHHDAPHSAP